MTDAVSAHDYVVRWELRVRALSPRHALDIANDHLGAVGDQGGANLFAVKLPNGHWVELDIREVQKTKD